MKYLLLFICCVIVGIVEMKIVVAPQPIKKATVALKATTTELAETESTTPEPITLAAVPIEAYTVPFYPRDAWGAREPLKQQILNNTQVSYIVVHDSGEPPMIDVVGCLNITQCAMSMKNIQNEHMDVNGWWDIGYNFAIGGEGGIYEGRGWGLLGAQLKYFNDISIGVAFIGSYNKLVPTLAQMAALNDLIATGIKLGYVRADYRLINHGQIKGTLCPGKKLSKKVLTLPHYSIFPESLRDLLDIPDIPDNVKQEIRKEIVSSTDAV